MIMPLLSTHSFFGEHGVAWLDHWLPLTIFAVITVVIFYNAFLMVARAFGLKDLERDAKSELMQAMATAVMAIMLVVLVDGAMTFASSMIHGDLACAEGPEHIDSLDDAFDAIKDCRIMSRAKQIASIQGKLAAGSSSQALFNFLNFDLSFFGITVLKGNWIPSVYEDIESRRIVNNLATSLLVSLNAQSFLITYIKVNMLNVFLPLGIILRSFKFTRGVGALFIGLAVGMYFIFPVVFVLLDPGFVVTSVPDEPPPQPQQYCYPTMGFATSIFNTMESSGAGSGLDKLTLGSLTNSLGQTYVSLIIHPLVSLFITLVFVRYMVSILGGDTLSLMRMVSKVV